MNIIIICTIFLLTSNIALGISQPENKDDNFINVYAGSTFALATKSDGTLWVWGKNDAYIGTGNSDTVLVPKKIGSGGFVDVVIESDYKILALKNDGSVYVWGELFGPKKPTLAGTGFDKIYIKKDGTLRFPTGRDDKTLLLEWGEEFLNVEDGNRVSANAFKYSNGVLLDKNGNIWEKLIPGFFKSKGDIYSDFVDISSSGKNVLGIKKDGSLWYWKSKDYEYEAAIDYKYEAAISTGDNSSISKYTPRKIGVDFKAVSVSPSVSLYESYLTHYLALKNDGSLWAWGSNANGQLGDGTHIDRLNPKLIGFGFNAISAGNGFSVALKNGKLFSWGSNNIGQLGDGTTTSTTLPNQNIDDSILDQYNPKFFRFSSTISANTSSFALKNDGTLWGWGGNTYCPPIAFINNPSLKCVIDINIPILLSKEKYTNIIKDYYLLKEDGSLWTTPNSGNYKYPDIIDDGIFYKNYSTSGYLRDYNIEAGIRTDGSLWIKGDNIRTIIGQLPSSDKPKLIGTEYSKVSVGSNHILALKNDGTLWGWGDNDRWQLGVDLPFKYSVDPVLIGNDFIDMEAGVSVSFAIKSDGSLWGWGSNASGQIDPSRIITYVKEPQMIGSNYIKVSSNGHTLGLKSDGSLYGWGLNYTGQLGVEVYNSDDLKKTYAPTLIGNGFIDISAGLGYSLALKNDGSLWGWGNNEHGQLGDGTYNNSFKPVMIGTGFLVNKNVGFSSDNVTGDYDPVSNILTIIDVKSHNKNYSVKLKLNNNLWHIVSSTLLNGEKSTQPGIYDSESLILNLPKIKTQNSYYKVKLTNIGNYIFHLDSAVMTFSATYKIGDQGPSGGIIFNVDDNGMHGLEAQYKDVNVRVQPTYV